MGVLKPTAKPLYRQVKQDLVKRVLAGEWKPGHILPSEFKLADQYGLSQGTIRKAIEAMAQEGLVTRQAGKGTFVTSHEGDYRPFRFHQFYSQDGKRIATDETRTISVRAHQADETIAKALRIEPDAPGTEIVRLRLGNGIPLLYERIFLSEELCPAAQAIIENEKPVSLYLFLERQYNLLITRVQEQLQARSATFEEAKLLDIDGGTPVLEAERIAHSLGGEPVEWRVITGPSKRTHYRNIIG